MALDPEEIVTLPAARGAGNLLELAARALISLPAWVSHFRRMYNAVASLG